MIIDCPTCASSYHVSPSDIDGGRTVVCARCDAQWYVGHGESVPQRFAMPRLGAPDRLVGQFPSTLGDLPLPPRLTRRVPRPMTLALAALAFASLTIGARARIVQFVPQTGAIYKAAGLPVNPRGLDFRDVRSERTDPTSAEVVVTGEIRNVAKARVRVPRLVFEVRDASGQELARWSETAPAKLVGAGRTLAFASTPHEVPPESRAVLVHFELDDLSS